MVLADRVRASRRRPGSETDVTGNGAAFGRPAFALPFRLVYSPISPGTVGAHRSRGEHMDSLTFLSTLAAVLLGGSLSFAGTWIQQRAESARERTKLASELAIKEYLVRLEKAQERGKDTSFVPLVAWQHLHLEVLKKMERNELDERAIRQIWDNNAEIVETVILAEKIFDRDFDKRS